MKTLCLILILIFGINQYSKSQNKKIYPPGTLEYEIRSDTSKLDISILGNDTLKIIPALLIVKTYADNRGNYKIISNKIIMADHKNLNYSNKGTSINMEFTRKNTLVVSINQSGIKNLILEFPPEEVLEISQFINSNLQTMKKQ